MAEVQKIDSNATGLQIAEEASLQTLGGSPTWYEGEPNEYNDFGGEVSLVARNPINPSRQRKKGTIVDLDAEGGFNTDLTFTNFSALWPGVFLSTKRAKFNKLSDGTGSGGSPVESIGASNDIVFDADVSADVRAGDLLFLSGFATAGNNGLKTVSSVTTDTVTVSETLTAEATAPSGANVKHVGFEFTSGDATITKTSGELPILGTTTKDVTQFGLIAGEFVYIGGDDTGASGDAFSTASNNGFCRVSAAPTTNAIVFDKTGGGANGETEMVTEAGGTKTIRLFFADIVRNESTVNSNYNLRTYHVERALGEPNPTANPGVIQSEVIKGASFNETVINVPQADKVTMDISFTGLDAEQRDGITSGQELLSTTTGSKSAFAAATAYNTSSNVPRIRLAEVRPNQTEANRAAPIPLFAYTTEITLTVGNNISANKAVGVLGGFDVTAGQLSVSAELTAYFADVAGPKAVRDNADITLDIAFVNDFGIGTEQRATGVLIDIPLGALGNARAEVTQDEAITLPLELEAAEYEDFGHTIISHEFFYLPAAAKS